MSYQAAGGTAAPATPPAPFSAAGSDDDDFASASSSSQHSQSPVLHGGSVFSAAFGSPGGSVVGRSDASNADINAGSNTAAVKAPGGLRLPPLRVPEMLALNDNQQRAQLTVGLPHPNGGSHISGQLGASSAPQQHGSGELLLDIELGNLSAVQQALHGAGAGTSEIEPAPVASEDAAVVSPTQPGREQLPLPILLPPLQVSDNAEAVDRCGLHSSRISEHCWPGALHDDVGSSVPANVATHAAWRP